MRQTIPTETILTILIATAVLFTIGFVVIIYFYEQRKRKYLHELEVRALQESFNETILRSKLEIQEITLDHIAKELHANFSHLASLININLSAVLAEIEGTPKHHITEAKQLAKQLMADIKRLSVSLNTDHIMETGFLKALENELGRLERTGKYQVIFTTTGNTFRLPAEKEIVIFRLCQEILNNILTHAKATEIKTAVKFDPARVTLSIADNGQGFDLATAREKSTERSSTGLMNIANRARKVNAELRIETAIGKGTQIEIDIPCNIN